MPVHLDTDFLVVALSRAGPERDRLFELAESEQDVQMSAVAWYEFSRGPRTPEQLAVARSFFFEDGIVPLSEELASAAAEVFRQLGSPRRRAADVAIGVTADSFVIYFERIRDEIREGHSLRHAIQSGRGKARGTILMADGVQLLAAVVLYFLAIGSVKGFAFTVGVTTAIDLLLVIFFTHPLMTLLGQTKFYGEGRKGSGLDPEHLGVSRESLLGRLASTRRRTRPDSKPTGGTKQTVGTQEAK